MSDPQDTNNQKLEILPEGFDLRNWPRKKPSTVAMVPLLPKDDDSRYRIFNDSATCGNPEDINRLMNGHIGDGARNEMYRILSTCKAGDSVEMDIYDDGSVEFGPKGLGKLRIRGRF